MVKTRFQQNKLLLILHNSINDNPRNLKFLLKMYLNTKLRKQLLKNIFSILDCRSINN